MALKRFAISIYAGKKCVLPNFFCYPIKRFVRLTKCFVKIIKSLIRDKERLHKYYNSIFFLFDKTVL